MPIAKPSPALDLPYVVGSMDGTTPRWTNILETAPQADHTSGQ